MSIVLLYHADDPAVSIEIAVGEHEHESSHRGIPDSTKEATTQIFKAGTTRPNLILEQLRMKGIEELEKGKLVNFLVAVCTQELGKSTQHPGT